MSAYNSFTFSISKYPLKKLEELITDDKVGLRLNENGSDLGRTIQMCNNLRILANNVLDKLPLTANGPQVEIGYNYYKLILINPLLQKNILKHDQEFQSDQCSPYIDELIKILKDIEQYIPHLTSNTASSMAQYLDQLIGNLTSVVELYDTIISTAKKCETQLSPKIPTIPPSEQQISYQVAVSLVAFEELLIQLYFLTENSDVKKSKDLKNLKEWIDKGSNLRQNLFAAPRSDEHQITKVVVDISAELANLSNIISKIQPSMADSADFTNASIALTNLLQALN